jgi:hypothetical protein
MPTRHSQQLSMTPHGGSTFEHVARRLRLAPTEYASSAKLKEWVRRHKDEKYVPSQLLETWGLEANVDTTAGEKKLRKRVA